MNLDWYNRQEDIEFYVKDLDTLHEFFAARGKAGYYGGNKDVHFKEFVILGRFYLDSIGNVGVMEEKRSVAAQLGTTRLCIPAEQVSGITISWSPGLPPRSSNLCYVCNEGWTLENCHDFEWFRMRGTGDTSVYTHKACWRSYVVWREMSDFVKLFEDAGLKDTPLFAKKNGYCQCEVCGPWFLAKTEFGVIEIGWRKRVIHIDWSRTGRKFDHLFDESENTTKWPNGIHAWGYEKAAEYLRRMKESYVR